VRGRDLTRLPGVALAAALVLPAHQAAAEPSGYLHRSEVRQFIGEMVTKHAFVRKDLNRVFSQAQFQPAIIKAMTQPVEATIASWQAYRSIFISPQRLEAGVQFWNLNADPLARAAREFGVPEEIIGKPATADLIHGQTDEGDFGISYAKADHILYYLISGVQPEDVPAYGFTAAEVELVRKRLDSTHWKRRLPTVAVMSQTAIGEFYLRPVDY